MAENKQDSRGKLNQKDNNETPSILVAVWIRTIVVRNCRLKSSGSGLDK
jgi:hypothetical protein